MSNLEHLSKRLAEYQEAANKAVVVELKARRAKQDVRAVRDRLFGGLAEVYGRLDDALSGLYRTLPATDRAELDGLLQRCKPQLSSTHPDRPIVSQDALTGLSRTLHRLRAAEAVPADLPVLSEKASAVLEILLALPSYRGMTGRQILLALDELRPPIHIDQTTLTKRVIPELKDYGIENKPKIGYRIPESRRISIDAPHMRP